MKKIIITIQILFAMSLAITGQHSYLLTQYTEHQSLFNPAFLSTDYLDYNQNKSAGLSYRYQWTAIEDAPQTTFGRFDYVLEGNNVVVFGGSIIRDKVGATTQTGISGRYAYHFRPSLNNDLLIGIGLGFGVIQYRIDGKELEFDINDFLAGNTPSKILPDFSVGSNITYNTGNGVKYYLGVSMPQSIGIDASFETTDDDFFSIKRLRHLYVIGGTAIPIGQQGFLEPSFWLKKTKNTPVHVDFNLRQKFANDFWVGVGYSTADVMHFETGIILTELIGLDDALVRVGYGFDYNLGRYSNFLGSTHEVNISYAW